MRATLTLWKRVLLASAIVLASTPSASHAAGPELPAELADALRDVSQHFGRRTIKLEDGRALRRALHALFEDDLAFVSELQVLRGASSARRLREVDPAHASMVRRQLRRLSQMDGLTIEVSKGNSRQMDTALGVFAPFMSADQFRVTVSGHDARGVRRELHYITESHRGRYDASAKIAAVTYGPGGDRDVRKVLFRLPGVQRDRILVGRERMPNLVRQLASDSAPGVALEQLQSEDGPWTGDPARLRAAFDGSPKTVVYETDRVASGPRVERGRIYPDPPTRNDHGVYFHVEPRPEGRPGLQPSGRRLDSPSRR